MKQKSIPSAIPIYAAAAVWLVAGLIFRLYKPGVIVVTAIVSAAVGIALRAILPKRVITVRDKAASGDQQVDRLIEEGRRMLDGIAQHGGKLSDPEVSGEIGRMTRAGEAIFSALEKDVGKMNQVRRFMNYYLPTASRLIERYAGLIQTGVSGENISSAASSIRNSLDMIADAFENQLDHLYRDEALDIETDIQVLDQVLATEGLKDDAGSPAQMGGH